MWMHTYLAAMHALWWSVCPKVLDMNRRTCICHYLPLLKELGLDEEEKHCLRWAHPRHLRKWREAQRLPPSMQKPRWNGFLHLECTGRKTKEGHLVCSCCSEGVEAGRHEIQHEMRETEWMNQKKSNKNNSIPWINMDQLELPRDDGLWQSGLWRGWKSAGGSKRFKQSTGSCPEAANAGLLPFGAFWCPCTSYWEWQ